MALIEPVFASKESSPEKAMTEASRWVTGGLGHGTASTGRLSVEF